jgi:exonuclease III
MTKKNVVKELIKEENIDILCLQETELDSNLNHDLLSFPQYCFESEINDYRSRVGIYIRDNINYIRRTDLEGANNHIVILDVESKRKLRLITIYRPFNPRDGVQPRQFFENQLNLINQALTNNTIIMGDFNLDWNKKDMQSYQFNSYFDLLDEKILNSNLIQIVENPTWSRIVNGTLRESLLDHIYVNDVTLFNEASEMTPYFGDHKMVYCTYNDSKHKPTYCQKRNWMHYNKEELVMLLSQIPWEIKSDSVQDAWNEIEYKLINIIDRVAPVEEFTDYKATKTIVTPSFIIAAKNKRKKLLSRLKTSRSPNIKDQIKTLDSKIRSFYHKRKTNDVRRSIIPGNTSSLWKAVNVAKDVHKNTLPKTLFKSNKQISPAEVPE